MIVLKYLILVIAIVFLILSWFTNILDNVLTSYEHGILSLFILLIVYIAWRKQLK